MDKKEYVVGFLFSPSYKKVILIKKNRPLWQEGYLNGVGGKMEKGEIAINAMIREFYEETGIIVSNWTLFTTMYFKDAIVYCFYTSSILYNNVKTITDEEIHCIKTKDIHTLHVIPNLKWLIPAVIYDRDRIKEIHFMSSI